MVVGHRGSVSAVQHAVDPVIRHLHEPHLTANLHFGLPARFLQGAIQCLFVGRIAFLAHRRQDFEVAIDLLHGFDIDLFLGLPRTERVDVTHDPNRTTGPLEPDQRLRLPTSEEFGAGENGRQSAHSVNA